VRSDFWRGVLMTLVVGGLVTLIAAALILWSGVVDVRATRRGRWSDRMLSYASTRSLRRHAKREDNPLKDDPRALADGLRQYRQMCLVCHGAPRHPSSELADGLNPEAPDLTEDAIQNFPDGMLYEIIASGIRSTGMPAFSSSHSPTQIWSIVAFVRHLPSLTDDESELLGERPCDPTAAR
jgi:mono/diheme cytochrome c family protein